MAALRRTEPGGGRFDTPALAADNAYLEHVIRSLRYEVRLHGMVAEPETLGTGFGSQNLETGNRAGGSGRSNRNRPSVADRTSFSGGIFAFLGRRELSGRRQRSE